MITQNDRNELESRLQQFLQQDISSVAELQAWLAAEKILRDEFTEMLTLHRIAFYGDTAHAEKRAVYLHDETDVQPLLTKYYAELDRKFCECPFTEHLDDANYGLMRKVRQTKVGALQLLHIYRQDPKRAIALYKQGAGTDYNQSIADVYRDTGVEFDFSAQNLAKIASFVEGLIRELK